MRAEVPTNLEACGTECVTRITTAGRNTRPSRRTMESKRYVYQCRWIIDDSGGVALEAPCLVTGKMYRTPAVPIPALERFLAGEQAQDALPMLSDPEREFLISG